MKCITRVERRKARKARLADCRLRTRKAKSQPAAWAIQTRRPVVNRPLRLLSPDMVRLVPVKPHPFASTAYLVAAKDEKLAASICQEEVTPNFSRSFGVIYKEDGGSKWRIDLSPCNTSVFYLSAERARLEATDYSTRKEALADLCRPHY